MSENGVELRSIQPGKPVQNAYIERFNSRFRDECLSGQRTTAMLDVRTRQKQPTLPSLVPAWMRCF